MTSVIDRSDNCQSLLTILAAIEAIARSLIGRDILDVLLFLLVERQADYLSRLLEIDFLQVDLSDAPHTSCGWK